MTHILDKNGISRHYFYYLPTILTGTFLVLMPAIVSFTLTFINFFVPIKYPDWFVMLFFRILAIRGVVVEFLLMRGLLPGSEELYLLPIWRRDISSTTTILGGYVGLFVILAGTFFINYILIKIVRVVLRIVRRRYVA